MSDYKFSAASRAAGKVLAIVGALVVAALLVIGFAGTAKAAGIDRLNAGSDTDYCSVAAEMFGSGYGAQRAGFARKIGPLTPADIEKLEHKFPLDKREGMKFYNWEQTDPLDQEFVALNVFEGYDFAAANPDDGSSEGADLAKQGKFQQCMQFRTAKKSAETEQQRELRKQSATDVHPGLMKIASSQALYDPRITDAQFCGRMIEVIESVLVLKTQGLSEQEVYDNYPLPENWSSDFQAYVKGEVSKIYASDLDPSAYLEQFAAECRI